jgi:hypothetical protein
MLPVEIVMEAKTTLSSPFLSHFDSPCFFPSREETEAKRNPSHPALPQKKSREKKGKSKPKRQ